MTKKMYMFGPYSLERARQYIREHHGENLVLLKTPDRRFAVCKSTTAQELKAKGYTTVETE